MPTATSGRNTYANEFVHYKLAADTIYNTSG